MPQSFLDNPPATKEPDPPAFLSQPSAIPDEKEDDAGSTDAFLQSIQDTMDAAGLTAETKIPRPGLVRRFSGRAVTNLTEYTGPERGFRRFFPSETEEAEAVTANERIKERERVSMTRDLNSKIILAKTEKEKQRLRKALEGNLKAINEREPVSIFRLRDMGELDENFGVDHKSLIDIAVDIPPEGLAEKTAEMAGGLLALVTRFAVFARVARVPIAKMPKWLQLAAKFELESQISGEPLGHGAAFGLGLTAVGALPVRAGFKLGLESAVFGSIAGMQGGDEIDMFLMMSVPGIFRTPHAVRWALSKRLGKVESTEDLVKVLDDIKELNRKLEAKHGPPPAERSPEERVRYNREYEASLTAQQQKEKLENIRLFRFFMENGRTQAEAEAETRVITRKPKRVELQPINLKMVTQRTRDLAFQAATAPETASGLPRKPTLGSLDERMKMTDDFLEFAQRNQRAQDLVRFRQMRAAGMSIEEASSLIDVSHRQQRLVGVPEAIDPRTGRVPEVSTIVPTPGGRVFERIAPDPSAPTADPSLKNLKLDEVRQITISASDPAIELTRTEVDQSRLKASKENKKIRDTPIDATLENGKLIITDGTHRLLAKRELNEPVTINVTGGINTKIEVSEPVRQLASLEPNQTRRIVIDSFDTALISDRQTLDRPKLNRARQGKAFRDEPIDAVFEDGKLLITDGMHRLIAKQELGETVKVDVRRGVDSVEPPKISNLSNLKPDKPTIKIDELDDTLTRTQTLLKVIKGGTSDFNRRRGRIGPGTEFKNKTEAVRVLETRIDELVGKLRAAEVAETKIGPEGSGPTTPIPERLVVVQKPDAPKIKPDSPAQELVKPIVLWVGTEKRPARRMDREEHARLLERDELAVDPNAPPDADSQYDWRVLNKKIRPPRADPIKTSRTSSIEEGEQKGEGFQPAAPTIEEVARELAVREEAGRQADMVKGEVAKLPAVERQIVSSLKGLFGTPIESPEVVAIKSGKTLDEVYEIEHKVELELLKTLGKEPQSTSLSTYRARRSRRGMVDMNIPINLYLAGKNIAVGGLNKGLNFFARSMNDRVGRFAGEHGKRLKDKFNQVANEEARMLGLFQVEHVESQKILNELRGKNKADKTRIFDGTLRAGYDLQEPKTSSEVQVWAVARLDAAIRLDNFVRSPAEMRVVNAIRRASMTTAELIEGIHVPGNESGRFEITLADGTKRPFKGTPEGRVMLNFPTIEMHDLMVNGPSDPLWRILIRGYHEANMHAMPNLTFKGTHEKWLKIREAITSNDPRSGFRQIGPEIERQFPVRPTHLLSPITKDWVPIAVTSPRQYLDTLYNSTAIRMGFVKNFGQDGKIIKEIREEYLHKGGNQDAFDSAVKTLGNIPPQIFGAKPVFRELSPAEPGYNLLRGAGALLSFSKAAALSATAIIQPTELFTYGAVGGNRALLASMADALFRSKEAREALFNEMRLNREYTIDVIDLTMRRQHMFTSPVNVMAQVLNRVHMNKWSNEFFNERPAALLARWRINRMIKRAIDKEKGIPDNEMREADVHFLRILGLPLEHAIKLASGRGSSQDYMDARRLGAETLVGTTSIAAQKSPFGNSRIGQDLIPFAQYFNNKARLWAREHDIWWQDVKNSKGDFFNRRMLRSSYQYGKFLFGNEIAGIAAMYIYAMSREGPAGFERMTRQMVGNPREFFTDSFAYAAAGPPVGALIGSMDIVVAEGEEAEEITREIVRIIYPVAKIFDILNVVKGVGRYRDRSGAERVGEFIKSNLPAFKTFPGGAVMNLMGVFAQDPKTLSAMRLYWTWMLNEANESVPGSGGSVGSRTDEYKEYRIHVRRAHEAIMGQKNPMPHIKRAYKADPRDLSASFKAWKLLDRKELNDEKREALEIFMGPEFYEIIKHHDFMIRQLIEKADYFSGLGAEKRSEELREKNIKLQLRKDLGLGKADIKSLIAPSQRLKGLTPLPSATPEFSEALATAASAEKSTGKKKDLLADVLAGIPFTSV